MNTKILLSSTWVVVILIYLLGDVLRIYFGGNRVKALADMNLNQFVWLGIAVLMLTPILMVYLTLVLPQSVSRWANIIVAAFFFLFNLIGLPTYPPLFDKFLLAASMGFNVVTIWYAWNWELSVSFYRRFKSVLSHYHKTIRCITSLKNEGSERKMTDRRKTALILGTAH